MTHVDSTSVDVAHYAAAAPGLDTVLVLAHGAGAGHRHPFMTAFGHGLAAAGIDVVTFNFPYMTQHRRMPDKAPVLEAHFQRVIDRVREGTLTSRRLFIGGKSMGGRMATHLAARGDIDGLQGVVALGYPLHPPGKPEQPRTAHLPSITVPVLIVQGERDVFGTSTELQPVIATMKAPVTLHVVEGGDHSFKARGRKSAEVYEPLFGVIAEFVSRSSVGLRP